MPISRQVDKKAVVHLYNGILLGCKKNRILPFATAWTDLEGITLSELSQSEKDLTHVESKKQNQPTNHTETESWIQRRG